MTLIDSWNATAGAYEVPNSGPGRPIHGTTGHFDPTGEHAVDALDAMNDCHLFSVQAAAGQLMSDRPKLGPTLRVAAGRRR